MFRCKDTPGWDALHAATQTVLEGPTNNKLTPNFKADEFCTATTGRHPRSSPSRRWSSSANGYLEPMRNKFGTCFILSGYRHERLQPRDRWGPPLASTSTSRASSQSRPTSGSGKGRRHSGPPTPEGSRQDRGKGGVGRYDRSGFVHVDNRGLEG